MGNSCCDESHGTDRGINGIKVPIEKPSEESPPTILKPDDFQSRKYLGKGIHLIGVLVKRKHVKSDRLFAMKIIDKSQIREKNLLQTDLIQKVLCHAPNPFLVEVVHTFQNSHKIYIVMQYVEGGDLYYYLAHKRFDEATIRKLIPQIVEGLEFLHDNNVIYRDLKPENVLVTLDGHIKLTDFGLAGRYCDHQPLYTYAGILEYMAPEVIEKKGYDTMVDMWSLGVLIYELKHGYTPFRQADSESTKRNILTKICEFEPTCSTNFMSLVHQLLARDPRERMTIQQLKKHPFVKDVNWNAVRERANEPPMLSLIKDINIKFKGAQDTAERYLTLVRTRQHSYLPNLHEYSNEQSL